MVCNRAVKPAIQAAMEIPPAFGACCLTPDFFFHLNCKTTLIAIQYTLLTLLFHKCNGDAFFNKRFIGIRERNSKCDEAAWADSLHFPVTDTQDLPVK